YGRCNFREGRLDRNVAAVEMLWRRTVERKIQLEPLSEGHLTAEPIRAAPPDPPPGAGRTVTDDPAHAANGEGLEEPAVLRARRHEVEAAPQRREKDGTEARIEAARLELTL